MRIVIGGLVLLLAASGLNAQTIYKCRSASGGLVYQNAPCASGSKELAAKDFNSDPDTASAIYAKQRIQAEMDQRNAALHGQSWVYVAPARSSDRDQRRQVCVDAKSAAAAAAIRGDSASWRAVLDRRAIDACFGF